MLEEIKKIKYNYDGNGVEIELFVDKVSNHNKDEKWGEC